eukprot:scaffold26742_cov60-Phaeocystis_antarctica.AAC.1
MFHRVDQYQAHGGGRGAEVEWSGDHPAQAILRAASAGYHPNVGLSRQAPAMRRQVPSRAPSY